MEEDFLTDMELMLKGDTNAPVLSAPTELNFKHPSTEPNYRGYVDRLIPLAAGKMNSEDRQQLLEDISSDFFKLDAFLFANLSSAEFAKQAWNKAGKEEKSPNLQKLTEIVNKMNEFVLLTVVGMTTIDGSEGDSQLAQRAAMLEFFIDLETMAAEKGDLHQAMAIHASISSSSILRLKKTWAKVSKTHMDKYTEIDTLLSNDKSYLHLRARVAEAKAKGEICMPFIGPYLTDYTFICEGNKIMTEEEEPKLVAETLRMFGELLEKATEPRKRIFEAVANSELDFELENDWAGELNSISGQVSPILDRVAEARDDDFTPRLQAMKEKLHTAKNIEEVFYAESLVIEPRETTKE
jgi:hypothetical protein